jgi:hypothetical protein
MLEMYVRVCMLGTVRIESCMVHLLDLLSSLKTSLKFRGKKSSQTWIVCFDNDSVKNGFKGSWLHYACRKKV